jgi:hypothetical protein
MEVQFNGAEWLAERRRLAGNSRAASPAEMDVPMILRVGAATHTASVPVTVTTR